VPSERRQLNVRLDPATAEAWDAVLPRVQAAVGLELSQAQVVALAVKALAEKYPPTEETKKGRGK
jgi:hypothetical protein